MTDQVKDEATGTPKLCPTELLTCPECGHEFALSPSAEKAVSCPECSASLNKSGFVPLTARRTVWISQSMLPQYYEQVVFKQATEAFYRGVDLYRELFIRNVDMRALKSIGFLAYGFRFGVKLAYSVDISLEEVAQLLRQNMDVTPLSRLMDSAKVGFGAGRGRPIRPERLTLLIDAMLLSLYPNGYLHFLRDALTLRHKEYTVSPTYAKSRKDSWDRFRTSKRATEVYCRRIWKDMFGREPEPVPEDWDLDVAREQGLMEDKYRPFPIA